ncbi:DUF3168 domain-containing protein [Robiginitomaculum antarcticum]|uniref:DUF3168 domain-containing protein n=1 Tax=Robiginitomaculum antarcticum TaxID=437507 RepID=UPI00038037C7|nr:DUF3168 domain-containing protein [Robiginitomaculum antarcticum]
MSAYNPALSVARALHSALSGDAALRGHLGDPARLYDHAPDEPVFPYLTYGPMRTEDISGDMAPLTAHTLTLHVWSRYGGRTQTLRILGDLRRVVEENLSANDALIIAASVLFSDCLRAPDGRTIHGILRVSIRTQPVDSSLEEVA